MKQSFKIAVIILFLGFVLNLSQGVLYAKEVKEAKVNKEVVLTDYVLVEPLELINNPANYLNKNIEFSAKFNKFSTLGLDYDRALRSSKDYISILIKRPDVPEEYTIPLSELKLIIKREGAEKFLDLESGDKIEIKGKVFSTALNDPWVDVYSLINLEPKKDKEDKDSNKNKADN